MFNRHLNFLFLKQSAHIFCSFFCWVIDLQMLFTYQTSLVAQMVKCLSTMQETRVQTLGREDLLQKEMGTHCSILAQKNPMDGGAWQATVHGVAKSWTRLSDFTFTLQISHSRLQLLMRGVNSGRQTGRPSGGQSLHLVSVPQFQ